MAALTHTNITDRFELSDKGRGDPGYSQKTYQVTTGVASATEWIDMTDDFSSLKAVIGSQVISTAPEVAVAPVKATGTITFTDVNVAAKLVTIDGIIYTSNADPDVDNTQPYMYNVHATTEEGAAAHLCDAINAGNGQGAETAVVPAVTSFGFGCAPNPSVVATLSGAVVTITARVAGTAGNAITLTTDETNATVSGATLTGGLDAVVGANYKLNAKGTGASATNGHLGIEASAATVVQVTVVGVRA